MPRMDDYSTTAVPEEQTQSFANLAMVFAGLTLSITAFLVGSTIGSGLTLFEGIGAIIVGNVLLALYAGILGLIGMRTRTSSTIVSRPAFGIKGQIVSSTIIALFLMGFNAVYATAIGALLHALFPIIPAWIGSIVFVACIVLTSIYGFKGMSWLSKSAIPLIAIFVIFGLSRVSSSVGGLSKVWDVVPTGDITFGVAVSVVFSCWATAATFSPDLARFAKNTFHVFGATFFAWVCCTTLLEIVGLICALGAGTGDLVQIMVNLNLVWAALITYLLLMWTSGQSLLYSFALALSNIENTLTKEVRYGRAFWISVGGVVAFIGSLIMGYYGLTSAFQNFLLTIGVAIPPIGGILIAHYFIVSRSQKTSDDSFPAFNYSAFVAWVVGICVAKFVQLGIPPLQGMFAALITYSIIGGFTTGMNTKPRSASQKQ